MVFTIPAGLFASLQSLFGVKITHISALANSILTERYEGKVMLQQNEEDDQNFVAAFERGSKLTEKYSIFFHFFYKQEV